MARIRTVKPDFFLHEELATLSPLHRLLFIGLWTLADKRGVLEDRPRRIKAALFPWDDCDVDAMLWDLAELRLVLRYEARKPDGEIVEALAVTGFTKHQRPHPKETACDLSLPDPSTASREKKRQAKPNQPAIPSSPAGKESWEGGLGEGKEFQEGDIQKPLSSPQGLVLAEPTKAIDAWDGDDWWLWWQYRRQESGYIPEKRRPPPRKVSAWLNEALLTPGVTPRALREGFYRFGANKHWESSDPPYPFQAFMADWSSYVRPETQHARAS